MVHHHFIRTLSRPGDTRQPKIRTDISKFDFIILVVKYIILATPFHDFSICPKLILMPSINLSSKLPWNNFHHSPWHCDLRLWYLGLHINSSPGRLALEVEVIDGPLHHFFQLQEQTERVFSPLPHYLYLKRGYSTVVCVTFLYFKSERRGWSQTPQQYESTRRLKHRATLVMHTRSQYTVI